MSPSLLRNYIISREQFTTTHDNPFQKSILVTFLILFHKFLYSPFISNRSRKYKAKLKLLTRE